MARGKFALFAYNFLMHGLISIFFGKNSIYSVSGKRSTRGPRVL